MLTDSPAPPRPIGLEYLVAALPVVVALVHLVMIETSSQTRWKGGGFGMYSDPHPNSYRVVWLVGKTQEGADAAFSLDPFDDRVNYRRIDAPSRRVALRVLHNVAEDSKNFPELADVDLIASQLRLLRSTDTSDEELERVLRLLPARDVRLRVVEISINEQYTMLEAKPILEVAIP